MSTYLHIAVEYKTKDDKWVPMRSYANTKYQANYSLYSKHKFLEYDEEKKKYITQYDKDLENAAPDTIFKNPCDVIVLEDDGTKQIYAESSVLCGNYSAIRELIYDSELCDFSNRGFPEEWKDESVRLAAYGGEYDPADQSWGHTWCMLPDFYKLSAAARNKWIADLKESYDEYMKEEILTKLDRIEFNLMSFAKDGHGCKIKAAPKKKKDDDSYDAKSHIEYMFEEELWTFLHMSSLCAVIRESVDNCFGYLASDDNVRLVFWCS